MLKFLVGVVAEAPSARAASANIKCGGVRGGGCCIELATVRVAVCVAWCNVLSVNRSVRPFSQCRTGPSAPPVLRKHHVFTLGVRVRRVAPRQVCAPASLTTQSGDDIVRQAHDTQALASFGAGPVHKACV